MSTTTKQFQLSHKLSKQLQREADALHIELEDYITDILLDRHKLQIINQTKKVETPIEKVETLISNNKPKPLSNTQSLLGLLHISVYNILVEHDITTVGALTSMKYSDLKRLPRIGPKTMKELDAFMDKHNLSYRG